MLKRQIQLPERHSFFLFGPRQTGKSTLLRMIAGVIRPTSGKVETGGRISALLELGAGFNPQSSSGTKSRTSMW